MHYFFTLNLLFFSLAGLFSQSDTIKVQGKKKGTLYASVGYTRVWFSKSDIHFVDRSNTYHKETGLYNNYDFTLYDAEATDRPNFESIPDITNFTIPQYVYRIGYYFNNKSDIGVEINFDHTKYVVKDYQKVRIKGDINGTSVDTDTILDPKKFLHFEHSDGANYLMANFIKRWKLLKPSPDFNAGWIVKTGVGVVIPKTDVTLFGERLNNDFHVAGWLVGVESGIRSELYKYTFIEFVGKVCYADFINSLVLGKGNGKASHHFLSYQLTATLGLQVPFLNTR